VTRGAPSGGAAAAMESDDDLASIEPADAAARPGLDAADVQLALRYLPDHRVVLVAEPQPDEILAVVADAAAYAGATLLVAVASGWRGTPPDAAVVVEGDTTGAESQLPELLGAVAARVDQGQGAADALRELIAHQQSQSAP
jgi:hypothetical protein